jgi:3-mercaptopyruvate sulfurtransferase SseA
MNEGRFRNDALLVSTEWLADRLGEADVRVVEVTPPGSGYIFAHIPGAVYLGLDDVFTGRVSGIRRTLGPLPEVVETLGRLGLSPDRHVVVHDALQAFAAGTAGADDLVEAYRPRPARG